MHAFKDSTFTKEREEQREREKERKRERERRGKSAAGLGFWVLGIARAEVMPYRTLDALPAKAVPGRRALRSISGGKAGEEPLKK